MSHSDVADSTDWLSTPLSSLSSLESALRCQVCKDFYETPMITSCSHTFCSLCIRRVLSSDSKCPLCRASEQEIKLRSNWSMEEAVEAFKKARSAVLDLAHNGGASNRSPKRKVNEIEDPETRTAPGTKRLRSSARLSRNQAQAAPSYAPEPEEEEVVRVLDEDDDYVPEPADGLVACPSCQKRMKEWQVFAHLESCPGPTTERKSPERNAISQLGAAQRQHNKSLERLPALSYGMLKDNALRKKMAELGISNQGPRVLLEKRHREWITLWNANCDAAWPKRRSELLRDLDMWERTQGGRAPTAGRATQNATVIKDKDFDGSAWAAKHDTSFRDLIASAQKSSAQAKKKPDTEETSQDEKPEENEIPQVSSAPLAEDVQMDSGVQETEAALDLGGNPPNQPDGPGHPVETTQPLPAELEVESTEEWKDVNHPGPSVCAP